MPTSLTVVQAIPRLEADFGGPVRSVTSLASELVRSGARVRLLALRQKPGRSSLILPADTRVEILKSPAGLRGGWPSLVSPAYRRWLARFFRQADILHSHGMWFLQNHLIAGISRQRKLPHVLSTRGMLEPWDRGEKWLKKGLAWSAYQGRDLRQVTAFHATSEQEVTSIRQCGLRQPVILLPNGVAVPEEEPRREEGRPGVRRALFLSRIHPKKGVLELLRAWKAVNPAPDRWKLVIAGYDDGGHLQQARALAAHLGLEEAVEFAGPVDDADKWKTYAAADLFVLPTFSENFGIVIAEALAAGLPVITTTGAPWGDIPIHRCGWRVGTGADALIPALREALAAPPEALFAMGSRGRSLVRERYAWPSIAARMLAAYEWILHGGSRPAWIHA